jgi:hypothetical protein
MGIQYHPPKGTFSQKPVDNCPKSVDNLSTLWTTAQLFQETQSKCPPYMGGILISDQLVDFIKTCGKFVWESAKLSTGNKSLTKQRFHQIWEIYKEKRLRMGENPFYPHIHRPYYDY